MALGPLLHILCFVLLVPSSGFTEGMGEETLWSVQAVVVSEQSQEARGGSVSSARTPLPSMVTLTACGGGSAALLCSRCT